VECSEQQYTTLNNTAIPSALFLPLTAFANLNTSDAICEVLERSMTPVAFSPALPPLGGTVMLISLLSNMPAVSDL
jgi:hypothetical protein